MPYPLTPPPANDYGAFTVPRQLQRWLDVNPIGKLTRTQGYITLPAFSVNQTWNGYSDIVASFNYEGPNNFTLYGFNIEPLVIPNYCLCISWRVNGVIQRYSLWRGAGEVFYFNVSPYTGQKIGKNFRFEIWSTSSTPAIQSSPLSVYTSVLGGVDYRWGQDFVLVSSDAQNNSFACSIPNGGIVAPNLYAFFNLVTAGGGGNFIPGVPAQWADSLSFNILFGTANLASDNKAVQNVHLKMNTTWDTINFAPTLVAFCIAQPPTVGYVELDMSGWNGSTPIANYQIQVNKNTVNFRIVSKSITYTFNYIQSSGYVYISACINGITCTVNAYSSSGALLGTVNFNIGVTSFQDPVFSEFSMSIESGNWYQIAYSTTLTNDSTTIPYMISINGFLLPLTFPSTSVSATN